MILMIVSAVIIAISVMVLFSQRQTVLNAQKLLKKSQEKTLQLEQKIETGRLELKKSKQDLEREKNALRDAREWAKKKLRRASETDQEISKSEEVMTIKELEDNNKALLALEAQIEQLKKEKEQDEQSLRAKILEEFNQKEKEKVAELGELKKKLADLQEELKKQKRLLRPEGIKIELKGLPDETASEFARVYRKAEQHERLHGIARAKLHLAQEKFTELQKRYFSVCRELAVLAGNKENLEPKAARDFAEKIVAESKGHAPQSNEHINDKPKEIEESS